jgi:hypothetical protein
MMGIMPNHSRVLTGSPSGSFVAALNAFFSTSMYSHDSYLHDAGSEDRAVEIEIERERV